MGRRLPEAIREARRKAESYRVCRAARGYAVWCFRDWSGERAGWGVLASLPTREAATANILERLGLEDPPQVPALTADDFYAWGFDFRLG